MCPSIQHQPCACSFCSSFLTTGDWLPEAFVPTQGFQGRPWDIHCGCKTVDNMASLVIYCLLGIVACKPTKAGITALRNKAIRSPLTLFDSGALVTLHCVQILMLGIWALDIVPWVLWQQMHERMFSENFRGFLENDTMWKPHLTHSWFFKKSQLTVGKKKKKRCFFSLFLMFLSFPPASLWRTGFSGGQARREEWLLESHLWHDYYKRQWTRTCFSPFFPPKITNSKLSCACMKVL